MTDLSNIFFLLTVGPSEPKEVTTPTTLPELFADRGVTLSQAANAIGVDILLLERVIAGRQPLAVDLVVALAHYLGVGRGDVESCAGTITTSTGAQAHVALPPDPVRGEGFPPFPLAETAAPPIRKPKIPSMIIWCCGASMGIGGTEFGQYSAVLRIERNSGLILTRTDLPMTWGPVELASDGATVFTASSTDGGAGYGSAELLQATGARLGETPDANFNKVFGLVFEPVSGTVWACCNGLPRIVRIDRNSGAVVSVVQLVVSSLGYGARDVVVVPPDPITGLLYVTGTRVGAPNVGLVFEVHPLAGAVLRTSVGLNMQDIWGIAYASDLGELWVTSAGSAGNTPMLTKMSVADLVPVAVMLTGDPLTLTNPTWIEYLFGTFWITDATAEGSRLMQVDASGAVLQSRTFGGLSGGHCASDGWFLWYADKANGQVHLLDPADISVSHVVVVTRGAPDGLLILPG